MLHSFNRMGYTKRKVYSFEVSDNASRGVSRYCVYRISIRNDGVHAVLFRNFFALIAGGVLGNGNEIPPPFGVVFLVMLLAMMLFGVLASLLVPLYQLIALIATVSVIRGNNFHYPILGRFLEGRMQALVS